MVFVYLDEHDQGKEDWTVYRQIVITISMYFHMGTIWLLKKPGFHHDGVQSLLKFITYINAYNLVFSLIFETSHFLELLVDYDESYHGNNDDGYLQPVQIASPHGNQSYFLVSFSTSFAIAHSNLWFLSQFWEWTQKKTNRNKMSDSRYQQSHSSGHHHHQRYGMNKHAIPLETPGKGSKTITILRDEYNYDY